MKITDINILDNTIKVTIQDIESAEITKVYIDSIYNYNNIFSSKDEDHTFTIDQFSTLDNSIQIDLSSNEDIDTSAFIVTINGESAFYFDKQELYYKQIELLTEHCSTCLDKEQKEKIVLFILKYQLLQYAISNNLLEDQINYYKDIARMLKIDVISNKQNINKVCNQSKSICRSCCNGMCSLC